MKPDAEIMNLRNAFKPEPETCHNALIRAARSAAESSKRKPAARRAAWIVAVTLIALVTVAFAANSFGLVDWFDSQYGIELPQAAQDILSAAQPKTIVVGPIAFTIQDILTDGRVTYLAVEAATADGSPAMLYMGNSDPSDSIGYPAAALLDTERINARTSYADAARIAGLPLYSLDAYASLGGAVLVQQEMMDSAYQENGSLLLIDMLYTDPNEVGDTLTANVNLRAVEIDTDTLQRKGDVWSATDARTIPISGVTAKKTYLVTDQENISVKFKITKVTAEQTCAGVYVTVHTTIDEGIFLMGLGRCFEVLDAQGNPYPRGISLLTECLDGDGNPLPTDPQTRIYSMQYRIMITADSLPDSLIISNGDAQVVVNAIPPTD